MNSQPSLFFSGGTGSEEVGVRFCGKKETLQRLFLQAAAVNEQKKQGRDLHGFGEKGTCF